MNRVRTNWAALALAAGLLGLPSGVAAEEPETSNDEAEAAPEKSRQLKTALKQLKKKEWALGSLSLNKVLEDEAQAYYHNEVRFYLAYALEQMGMKYSALEEYNRFFLAVDSDHELIPQALKRGVSLGRQMDAGWILAPGLTRLDTSKVTAGFQGPAMFWVGKHWYQQSNWALARAYLSLVPKGTEYYAEARMIEGIAFSRDGKPAEAVASFSAAIAAADPNSTTNNVWEVANLNLGRTYYALGNFERAIEHFEDTSRGSPLWFESLYEAAWSYFRLGRLSGALSHLQTVDSPFFDGIYHPDATLLRTLIFYYLCKYIDGQVMLNDFTEEHYKIQKTLTKAIARADKDPATLFDALYAWKSAGKDAGVPLPNPVKQFFATDESLLRIGDYVAGIDAELAAVARVKTGWERSSLRRNLDTALKARKDAARSDKGREVLARLRGMNVTLGGHLGNAELYKVEMITAEKNIYDAAYRGNLAEKVAKRALDTSVPEGYRLWPFEGEYWIDEIGWYEVNTINECLMIRQ